jgi:hypothetical protein
MAEIGLLLYLAYFREIGGKVEASRIAVRYFVSWITRTYLELTSQEQGTFHPCLGTKIGCCPHQQKPDTWTTGIVGLNVSKVALALADLILRYRKSRRPTQ